jgi:hypothetical protein
VEKRKYRILGGIAKGKWIEDATVEELANAYQHMKLGAAYHPLTETGKAALAAIKDALRCRGL